MSPLGRVSAEIVDCLSTPMLSARVFAQGRIGRGQLTTEKKELSVCLQLWMLLVLLQRFLLYVYFSMLVFAELALSFPSSTSQRRKLEFCNQDLPPEIRPERDSRGDVLVSLDQMKRSRSAAGVEVPVSGLKTRQGTK